jgi:hypothetical protein
MIRVVIINTKRQEKNNEKVKEYGNRKAQGQLVLKGIIKGRRILHSFYFKSLTIIPKQHNN